MQAWIKGALRCLDTAYTRRTYTGSFLSEDPDQQNQNWFVYCDSNPTTRCDATGRNWQDVANYLINMAIDSAGTTFFNMPPGWMEGLPGLEGYIEKGKFLIDAIKKAPGTEEDLESEAYAVNANELVSAEEALEGGAAVVETGDEANGL